MDLTAVDGVSGIIVNCEAPEPPPAQGICPIHSDQTIHGARAHVNRVPRVGETRWAESAEDCQAQCMTVPECTGWVHHGGYNCWLVGFDRDQIEFEPSAGYVSGLRCDPTPASAPPALPPTPPAC